MYRGLPQGAPESPLIFTLVTEIVLRQLSPSWSERSLGWSLDGFHLSVVFYADHILLVSSSKRHLEMMLTEAINAFRAVGLDVSTEKCHWTCYPAKPGSQIKFARDRVKWDPSLTFVGTVLDLCGNDGLAMEHRISQGTKVFHKWRRVLQCRHASARCRVQLGTKTFFAAVLWLAETWHLTQSQRSRLRSWGDRMIARVLRCQRRSSEGIDDFWKRLHRTGRFALQREGGSLDDRRRLRLHTFAGRIARTDGDVVASALRTRSLALWRFFQSTKFLRHPARLCAWRWEAQLTDFYGEVSSVFIDDPVGWMLAAQNRQTWKATEQRFSTFSVGTV